MGESSQRGMPPGPPCIFCLTRFLISANIGSIIDDHKAVWNKESARVAAKILLGLLKIPSAFLL